MATESELAKAEAIKRFRASVRLELSIAGDYVIGRNLDKIKKLADDQIAAGGVPALESGVGGSMAKQIADRLSQAFERELDEVLAITDGNDSPT